MCLILGTDGRCFAPVRRAFDLYRSLYKEGLVNPFCLNIKHSDTKWRRVDRFLIPTAHPFYFCHFYGINNIIKLVESSGFFDSGSLQREPVYTSKKFLVGYSSCTFWQVFAKMIFYLLYPSGISYILVVT
jgi:hypothetical protein